MTCFAGDTLTSTLVLEEWHDISSFYDSILGRSPLMQLCRMVDLARADFYMNDIVWHRIGSDTSDEAFAVLDYEAHPTWNPLSDYDTLLTQCAVGVYEILQIVSGHDCYNRFFTDRASIISSIGALSLSNLGVFFREDALAKMVRIREYLEMFEGAEITRLTWGLTTISFAFSLQGIYGYESNQVPAVYTEGSGFQKHQTASDIEPTFGGYKSKFGGAAEHNPYPGSAVCEPSTHSTPGALQSFFVRGGTVFPESDYYVIGAAGGDSYCESHESTDLGDSAPPPSTGWFERTYTKAKFEISLVFGTPTGFDFSLLDGKTVDWHLEAIYTEDELPHIDWAASVTSGSHPLVIDGEINTDPLEIDLNIIDAHNDGNWATHKQVTFMIVLDSTMSFDVCKDACGFFHLAE